MSQAHDQTPSTQAQLPATGEQAQSASTQPDKQDTMGNAAVVDQASGAGDEGKEEGGKGRSGSAVLDLSKTITASRIASLVRLLANEPGESGELRFEVRASGAYGAGIVQARLSGWADLAMVLSMNDQNMYSVAVEASGALRAGIDLAGFASAGVTASYGGDFMDYWWRSSTEVADWILDQLRGLDEAAGGGLFDLGDGGSKADRDHKDQDKHDESGAAFQVHEEEVGLGVDAKVDVPGVAGVEGSMEESLVNRTYHDMEEGHEIPSKELHKKKELKIEAVVGGVHVAATYTGDWSNTTGSPFFYANGVFNEQDLVLSVQLEDLLKIARGRLTGKPPAGPDEIARGVQPAVVRAFEKLGAAIGGFKWMARLNAGLFGTIAGEVWNLLKSDVGMGLALDIHFDWNEYGEADGTLNLMYFRVLVESVRTVSAGADRNGTGIGVEASSSKSEVVYETIGAETMSYVQRQYVYRSEERDWGTFKKRNRPELERLVANLATPGGYYYYASVDKAWHSKEGGDFEAAMAALEHEWDVEHAKVLATRHDAARIAELVDEGTSFWTWFDSTKQRCMNEIIEIVMGYRGDKALLAYFLDSLPAYEVDMDALVELAEETGMLGLWQGWQRIADAGRAELQAQ